MPKMRAFTQQSREQVLNSITNQSTSKQAWSFSKQKRFVLTAPTCPYVSYNNNWSTITNRKTSFGSSRRKVFTETSQGPCSWIYRPSNKNKTSAISFAAGRSEILANNYIERDPIQNPGPGRYQSSQNQHHGYTMRPKTANHRNYFIEDKQQASIPGPGNYDEMTSKMTGKNLVSKFRSTVLGGSLMNKSKRFASSQTKTPSVWDYKKDDCINLVGKGVGSIIGHEARPSFTQKASRNSFTPGPGNYKMPTQFAHYKKLAPYL